MEDTALCLRDDIGFRERIIQTGRTARPCRRPKDGTARRPRAKGLGKSVETKRESCPVPPHIGDSVNTADIRGKQPISPIFYRGGRGGDSSALGFPPGKISVSGRSKKPAECVPARFRGLFLSEIRGFSGAYRTGSPTPSRDVPPPSDRGGRLVLLGFARINPKILVFPLPIEQNSLFFSRFFTCSGL